MKLFLRIALPILLIALAWFTYGKLAASRPEKKSPPVRLLIPKVEMITASPEHHQPPLESFGTVHAFDEATLTPQIDGLIVSVSPEFRVGRRVKKDTSLIEIDPRSYNSLLTVQLSNLADAELAFAEEKITAQQAADDWVASGRDLDDAPDFVLRKQQLASARANIEAREAEVRKAKADIGRTQIHAPFDAIITSQSTAVGDLASPSNSIGTLIATEKVEVTLPLTPSQVARVALFEENQDPLQVTFTTPAFPDQTWTGTITRLDPALGNSQTLNAIAEIAEPFGDSRPPLSVGLFLQARIPSKALKDTLKIPQAAFVDDSYLWMIDADEKLFKAPAKRLQESEKFLFLQLIAPTTQPPYRIVSRPLVNFRTGMTVTTKKP